MTKSKKQNLNEDLDKYIDPKGSAIASTIWLLWILFMLLIGKAAIKSLDKKVDKNLTSKMRKITGDNELVIYICLYDEVNAFCDGSPNLYYFRGLVKKLNLSEDELIAIMLHEYGHFKERHVKSSQTKLIGSTTLSTAAVNLANIPFQVRLFLTMVLNNVVMMGLSRAGKYMEVEADDYPGKFGYKNSMISALKKLKKYMYSEMCPGLTPKQCDKYMDSIHYWNEHPTPNERLRNIGSKIIKLGLSLISMNKKDEYIKLINKLKKAWLHLSLKGTSQFTDRDVLEKI